jgi:D-alanyl-lipoteichoic acid acyltransferase DltB (MBOAT superfamily)
MFKGAVCISTLLSLVDKRKRPDDTCTYHSFVRERRRYNLYTYVHFILVSVSIWIFQTTNLDSFFNYSRPVYPEYRKLPMENCFLRSNRIGKTRNHERHTVKFVYINIGVMKCKLLKVFHVGFHQNLWNGLWDAWESPFKVFFKLDCIVD